MEPQILELNLTVHMLVQLDLQDLPDHQAMAALLMLLHQVKL